MSESTYPFEEPARSPDAASGGRVVAWLRQHQGRAVLCAIGLQLAIVGGMIVRYSAPIFFGERILLRTVPVDPRDLFRGDYVILSYPLSRVPLEGIEGIPQAQSWPSQRWRREDWLQDRTVYAWLEPEPDGKHYRARKVSIHRPPTGKFLKGRFTEPYGMGQLRFGIEAYYLKEGTGHEYEQARNNRSLSAEVALAPWGQATLVGLKIQ